MPFRKIISRIIPAMMFSFIASMLILALNSEANSSYSQALSMLTNMDQWLSTLYTRQM